MSRAFSCLRESAQGADERGQRELPGLPDAHRDDVARVGLHLHPGPFIGNDGGVVQDAPGDVHCILEVDAGRSGELADHHSFGAVDDERPPLRHQGQVAQVDVGLHDVAVARLQADESLDGRLVRQVTVAALFQRVLGGAHVVIHQLQLQVAGEIRDGRKTPEELPEAVSKKPFVGVQLDLDQIGQFNNRVGALQPVLYLHDVEVLLRVTRKPSL